MNMDFFKDFQRFLVKKFIISAPVERGVDRERRKAILFNFVILCINMIRFLVMMLVSTTNNQYATSWALWVGDFFFFLGPLGVLINAINLVLHFGYLMNRATIYRQEGEGRLHILQTLSNGLISLPPQKRQRIFKFLRWITKLTIFAWTSIWWGCCIQLTMYAYIHSNYHVRDTIFGVSSTIALMFYIHGIYIGFSTVYAVHGLIALSVEYTVARINVVRTDVANLVRNLDEKLDATLVTGRIDRIFLEYDSFCHEIRRHNRTLSHLLRHEVIILCPTIAIAITFLIVDAPPVAKAIVSWGASAGIATFFSTLVNAGRVHSRVLSLYPLFQSIQVRLPLTIKSKMQLEKCVKELGSREIPSFTLGVSNPFTKTSASNFAVATVTVCLLLITNSLH